jgi:hypothetical protein
VADKKTLALQGLYDRFFSDFLVPLVRGGTVQIGAPIAPGVLPFFFGAVPSNGADAAELLVARQAVAADLLPELLPPRLTEDDVRVGAALHNLLYRTHPDLEGVRTGRARRRSAEWAQLALEEAREPEGRSELLERHTLVAPLFRTSRVDTVLYNWSYRYRFYGREPPARFLAWPSVRRIRQEKTDTPFTELSFDAAGVALLAQAMQRSPLTALVTPTRTLPTFVWSHDMVVALRDEAVCRAVTYAHLDQGLGRVAGPLGAAFDGAVEHGLLSAEDLFFVACFCYNLLLTLAVSVGERTAREIETAARGVSNRTLFAVQLALLQQLPDGAAPLLPLAEPDRAAVVVALGNALASAADALQRAEMVIGALLGGAAAAPASALPAAGSPG